MVDVLRGVDIEERARGVVLAPAAIRRRGRIELTASVILIAARGAALRRPDDVIPRNARVPVSGSADDWVAVSFIPSQAFGPRGCHIFLGPDRYACITLLNKC